MFSSVRQAIVSLLETSTTLQKVYRTEVSSFEGFPAAVLSVGGNEAGYGSTTHDRIVYNFTLRVYYPLKSADVQETEEIAMEKCCDELLVLLRRRDLQGINGWLEPVMTDPWVAVTNGDSVLYMATLRLRFVGYAVQENG